MNSNELSEGSQEKTKLCLGCKTIKELNLFRFRRGKYDNKCNPCKKNGIKIGYGTKINIIKDELGIEKRECTICKQFKYFSEFPKCKNRNSTGYQNHCKLCSNKLTKISYYKHIDKRKAKNKKWSKANPDKCKEQKRRQREKNKSNPFYNINKRMGGGIRTALERNSFSKNGRHWESLVGYTVEEAKLHIENQFTEGMNWERFCNGDIHIDHILPCELFEYVSTDSLQFKYCWSLKNLRPLWKIDNWTKFDYLPSGQQASKLSTNEKKEYLISLGLNYLLD